MKIELLGEHALRLKDDEGRIFRIEDTQVGKIRITVPNDRITYRTEQGNNNADFVELVK